MSVTIIDIHVIGLLQEAHSIMLAFPDAIAKCGAAQIFWHLTSGLA